MRIEELAIKIMSMTSAQIIEGSEAVKLSDELIFVIDNFKAGNYLYIFEIYNLAEWLIKTNQQNTFLCHARQKQ